MEPDRLKDLNENDINDDGTCVLYWMQQSQRTRHNPALEYAVRQANDLGKPLHVLAVLDADEPFMNARKRTFQLEGLRDVKRALAQRSIPFSLRVRPWTGCVEEAAQDACLVVCDRGYLRHQVSARRDVAGAAACRAIQVEGDVVVPVEEASDKREYAARTIRPKLEQRWGDYLTSLSETRLENTRFAANCEIDFRSISKAVDGLGVDPDIGPVNRFEGGQEAAKAQLTSFIRSHLNGYEDNRNDASRPQTSGLSPYLRFGHISPVEVARKVRQSKAGGGSDGDAFLEEMIVRRELAINYVTFEPEYDSYGALPDWARETLNDHKSDARPDRYSAKQLEAAATDDPIWNAAQMEMVKTGYMHNMLRMYWGKQILCWCNTPQFAYRTALDLNNRYFLDGGDANSFANIGWLFGLHDRAWEERDVIGKVRPMTDQALRRKFDVDAYIDWVEQL